MRSGRIKIPYDHPSNRLEQPRLKVSVVILDTTQASGEGKVSIVAWAGPVSSIIKLSGLL